MPFYRRTPPRGWLEGSSLWVYGSSFTVDPGLACTSGMEFYKLVRSRLNMAAVTTYGVSGKSIRETAKRVVGGNGIAGAQWTPARKGVAVIDTWVNDLAAYGAGPTPRAFVAKDITGIKANLMAALAYISAGTLYENTAGTKGGTWAADGAATDRSGGSNSVSATAGATMTWTGVTVAEDHFFYLAHTLEPNSFSLAPVEVLVDGVIARTIAAAEFQCHASVEGGTVTTGNAGFRIPATAGAHTVTVRHAGTNGQNMLVDALVVPKPKAQRPPVFVVQDQLPRGVTGGPYWKPADIPVLQGNWSSLLDAYREVLAVFPNSVFVPSTLNAATDYGPDGLHPNDRGMVKKADELVSAMQKWLTVNRPDALYATL